MLTVGASGEPASAVASDKPRIVERSKAVPVKVNAPVAGLTANLNFVTLVESEAKVPLTVRGRSVAIAISLMRTVTLAVAGRISGRPAGLMKPATLTLSTR